MTTEKRVQLREIVVLALERDRADRAKHIKQHRHGLMHTVDAIQTGIANAGYVLLPASEQRHLAALIAFVEAIDADESVAAHPLADGYLLARLASGRRKVAARVALDEWHPR